MSSDNTRAALGVVSGVPLGTCSLVDVFGGGDLVAATMVATLRGVFGGLRNTDLRATSDRCTRRFGSNCTGVSGIHTGGPRLPLGGVL